MMIKCWSNLLPDMETISVYFHVTSFQWITSLSYNVNGKIDKKNWLSLADKKKLLIRRAISAFDIAETILENITARHSISARGATA